MGTTLQIAGQMGAYTLTDRATFAQHATTLALGVVFEGGRDLLNTYAVIVDPSGPNANGARLFAEWLAAGDGRTLIDRFALAGSESSTRGRSSGRETPRVTHRIENGRRASNRLSLWFAFVERPLARLPDTSPNFGRIVELNEAGELPIGEPSEGEGGAADRCAVA